MKSVLDDRLNRLRGSAERKANNARSLAALESNPRCALRAVLDAAGADKEKIAAHAGFEMPSGRSVFAMSRGNSFETMVKANGGAELVRLLRQTLELPLKEVAYEDLNEVGGRAANERRYARTRQLLLQAARGIGIGTLYDHPMLRFEVGGHPVFLEPDMVAFRAGDRFYIVEIKSFPIVDGQADPSQVKAATSQAAAYIVALRAMLAEAGVGPEAVSETVVLVAPKDFTNRPTADTVDASKQVKALQRQLQRIERIGDLLSALPDGLTFDLAEGDDKVLRRPAAELIAALDTVPANYRPACLSTCELAFFCRDRARARQQVDVLGTAVREQLGGIDTVTTALGLARGRLDPAPDQVEAAAALRYAARLRAELAGAAGVAA